MKQSRLKFKRYAQSTVEFSFCLILVALLMFGLIKMVQWAGLDLAKRRAAHEDTLVAPVNERWASGNINKEGPPVQFAGNFYNAIKMDAVFNQW